MKKRITVLFVALLLILSALLPVCGRMEVQADSRDYDLILPDSDTRLYTKWELQSMPPQVMAYARNEIYARHGRIFQYNELKEYFELQSWYYGKIKPKDFTEDLLNEYELDNVALLVELEAALGDKRYEMDQDGYSYDEVDRYISTGKNIIEEDAFRGIAEDLSYEEDSRLLRTRYLEMDIPAEWEDHFGIFNPSEDVIELYCILAHQQDSVHDGVIFSVIRQTEYISAEEETNARYLGECGNYYYYFEYPQDERYDPEDQEGAALYQEMAELIDEIADAIRLIP